MLGPAGATGADAAEAVILGGTCKPPCGTPCEDRARMTWPRLALLLPVGLLSVVMAAPAARASPSHAGFATATEDAIAAGDLDAEDLVARPLVASLPRASAGRAVVPPSRGGSAWVSLLAFARPAEGVAAEEIGGALVVGLPLDRMADRRSATANASPRVELVAAREREMSPTSVLPPRVARACIVAAWKAAGLGQDDRRLDGIVSRARWSALLPEARVRAVRGQDERASLETTADTNRIRGSAGADLAMEARLTWRLDRLLFADDEPSFERIRLERHDARMRVAARALEALFHWQRASVDLRSGSTTSGARDDVELLLRIAEAEATLDVLTGGWFTSSVREGLVVLPPPPAPTPASLGGPT
jgi:hypothetical protein